MVAVLFLQPGIFKEQVSELSAGGKNAISKQCGVCLKQICNLRKMLSIPQQYSVESF